MQIDPKLKEWATDRQAEYIDAVNAKGTISAAARALKINRRMVQKGLKAVKEKAASKGYAPDYGLNSPIPSPFIAKGHSTMERVHPNGEREQLIQWTKTRLDDLEYQEAILAGLHVFMEDMPTPKIPHRPRGKVEQDIIPWINIGDAHLGMIAFANETGYDWDMEQGERELLGAAEMLIDELPHKYDRIVVQDMGDATHYDNCTRVTEKSRHALDNDKTYPDMIRCYVRVMRSIIEKALEKAKVVDVIINQANHSRSNDWWMVELLTHVYGASKRVNIINNDSPFIVYKMGDTSVLCHHSDLVKPKGLISVFTHDFRETYGATKHHYIDIGHIHHEMVVKQHPEVRVESFNQLARPDKHAHQGGWRNRNSITMIYRSRSFGEVGRRTLGIDELQTKMYGKPIAANRPVFEAA